MLKLTKQLAKADQDMEVKEEGSEEVRADSGQVKGEKEGYLYDYSQWFTPFVADDGITYYQSYDGHVSLLHMYFIFVFLRFQCSLSLSLNPSLYLVKMIGDRNINFS